MEGADHDQDRKLPIYAKAGIPEVWLLDLERNLLHAFRHPEEGVYTEHRISLPGEGPEPLAFPGVRIAWD